MTEFVRKGRGTFNPLGDRLTVQHGIPQPTVRIGGSEYPLGYGKGCRVCNCQWRNEIENHILASRGYPTILKLLPVEATTGDDPITARHISEHIKNQHLPTAVAVAHIAVQQRAKEIGRSMEEFEGTLVDRVLVGQEMLNVYYQDLINGVARPTGSEAVSVMKMFAEMDQAAAGSVNTEVYNQVISVMLETFQRMVPEKFDEIVYRIQSHPVVKAILEDMNRKAAIESSTS